MFKIGDYIFHKSEGICLITDIIEVDNDGLIKTYYVMKSKFVENSSIIRMSTLNCPQIRKTFTKKEIEYFLSMIPSLTSIWNNDSRKRKELYHSMVGELNPLPLLTIIKTLNAKKREYVEMKKVLPLTDQITMNLARKLLSEEISHACDIEINKVIEDIIDTI